MTTHLLRRLIVVTALIALLSPWPAVAQSVTGWWRFEAPIGTPLGGTTIPDASNDAKHPAEAHAREGGSLVAMHELPGRYVYDGLSGEAYENTSSLLFDSTVEGEGKGKSDYLVVDDGIGRLKPASFTIEGFMMSAGKVDKWHSLMSLRDPRSANPHAWSLSTENLKGAKKLRFGGHKAPKGYWGNYTDNPSVNSAGWHHFAYVFEHTADGNSARLYWDGNLVSESKPADPAYTDAQKLYIGGSPDGAGWVGYLDEIRYTAAALKPEQFLMASDTKGKPEGSAAPIALGLRKEPLKPLDKPVEVNLPDPVVGPASVHVPGDAGLVNVQTDYGAKGDGMTDDTAAIKRAVGENVGKHRTLYFPPGTYVISEPIDWKSTAGAWNAFLTWQGAGMGRTFIYLREGSVEFGMPDKPRAVTSSGSIPGMGGSNPVTGAGNRAHNNYIMDMTFVIGEDNPGAIGVDFNASNTGAMENVRIVALGDAAEGLRLTRQVGCLLVKNLEVHGFDTGIRAAGDLYGSTLTNIRLAGQQKVGIHNTGHNLAIEKLISDNAVTAILNDGETGRFEDSGLLTLIDSDLRGGKAELPAIDNQTAAMLRNVRTAGYGRAVAQADGPGVTDATVREYAWPAAVTLFDDTPQQTLDLPMMSPPQARDLPSEQWVSVAQFIPKDADKKADRSEAIQKAIDSGAKVVYFPTGTYRVFKPVVVRGNVERLIGYQSWMQGPEASRNETGEGLIVFENSQPVSFERFNTKRMALDVRTDKPVTFRHMMSTPAITLSHDKATVFSENTVGGRFDLRPGQSWRAWQLNIETKAPPAMVNNEGGTFWVLGYKTEQGNTVCRTTNGGKSEILGGLWYPAQGFGKDKEPVPAIIVDNASLSVSFTDMCKGGGDYSVLVQETRDGRTQQLPGSALQRKWGLSGSITLFRAAAD